MKKLILFLLLILMWSVCVNAQTKFNEYYDWSTKQHKERLDNDGEKYQIAFYPNLYNVLGSSYLVSGYTTHFYVPLINSPAAGFIYIICTG